MMILAIYSDTELINIIEAPDGGTTYSNYYLLKATIEDAKTFFEMKGFDTTKIDEYEPVNDEFTQ